MKVLEINTVCNGSTGHIAQDIAKDFISNGNECVIAYGRGNPPKDIKSYRIGSKLSIYFHVLMTRLFDKHGFASKHATKKFIKWIEEYNPDLIWLHNIHGYYLNIEMLFQYLNKSGKKVNWTLHDCWAFTGHCSHFTYAKCDKWKKQCNNCPVKKEYPSSILFDNCKNNYKKKKEIFNLLDKDKLNIITPSNWLASIVKESFLNKYNVEVINNKVDTNIFKPITSNIKSKYGIENKKIILGVASVWDKHKGFDDFIELSNKISNDYMIILIGLNNQQIEKTKELSNIIGLERTNNIFELVEFYSAADVYLSTSIQETFGMTFWEAYYCGCQKIIGYKTTAITETLDKIKGYAIDYNENRLEEICKLLNK